MTKLAFIYGMIPPGPLGEEWGNVS